jgi:hypothetical protein
MARHLRDVWLSIFANGRWTVCDTVIAARLEHAEWLLRTMGVMKRCPHCGGRPRPALAQCVVCGLERDLDNEAWEPELDERCAARLIQQEGAKRRELVCATRS